MHLLIKEVIASKSKWFVGSSKIKTFDSSIIVFANMQRTFSPPDKTFTDLIKDSLGDEPKGYMVSSTWDTTNTSKLKVKLDKGDISYLPEKTDEYILDYTNTKVNQNSYRQKYVMNKFNYFIAEDMKIDKDSKKSSDKTEENKVTNETVKNTSATSSTDAENTENKNDTTAKVEVSKNSDTKRIQIIGAQNILYLNATSSDVKSDYKKAEGKVKTVFEIKDGKLVVTDVLVEK